MELLRRAAPRPDVIFLNDHVAQIDADPELYPPRWRDVRVASRHPPLNFGSAQHRVGHAVELEQHAVAGGLDDAAAVLRDAGSMSSIRWVLRRASVPVSSTSISRL